ncbi:MAG: hypothetical protein LUE93_13275 [Bacteroides sp.]|nr:hypothetical protein [Bacteroides sp.]
MATDFCGTSSRFIIEMILPQGVASLYPGLRMDPFQGSLLGLIKKSEKIIFTWLSPASQPVTFYPAAS